MSSRRSNDSNNFSYDKYAEHQDNSSFGKLRSKYWTTKQLVIKKLGREQDEFVIASDADVDAKLELLQAIRRSCFDLRRIMERYQTNVLLLSHEETDLARFLKDYAQFDKTRAGKMMSSVSKVLAFTAQQRLALRQPLHRLHGEIDTFSRRAVTDTMSTVRRMETARTEYRGSILWLKDASVQLDPDKQLEKFRRVQSQVKTTKNEYDRLKSDVIQKIDLLTASRCNMYSHVLAAYQKALLVFWEKTSKTMSAVAESFKGYQHYEFTVIKDLAEPSRLLAEMNSSAYSEKSSENENKTKKSITTTPKETKTDDTLIDINESAENQQEQKQAKAAAAASTQKDLGEVTALIDISDAQLDDQLLELEKLTTIDQAATAAANTKTTPSTSNSGDNLVELLSTAAEHEKLFSDLLSPLSSLGNNNTSGDLLGTNESSGFDADWNAAFGISSNQQQQMPSTTDDITASNSGYFLPSSLLNELLASASKIGKNQPQTSESINKSTVFPLASNKAKPMVPTGKSQHQHGGDKSNWLNLFAELDPLQNPDALGKTTGDEADRSC